MSGATTGMSNNYNSNSSMQKFVVQSSVKFIEEAIDVLDVASVDIIADFGCSQGLNSIYAMKAIINYLKKTNKYVKEPFIIHNDLPTNNWRTLFQLLIEDNSYKSVASGRSFYEQCLPNNSPQIGYQRTHVMYRIIIISIFLKISKNAKHLNTKLILIIVNFCNIDLVNSFLVVFLFLLF